MNVPEKLDMLIKYERIDSPTTKKERFAWGMYTSEKIANFIGAAALSQFYGLTDERTAKGPTIYSMIFNKLTEN